MISNFSTIQEFYKLANYSSSVDMITGEILRLVALRPGREEATKGYQTGEFFSLIFKSISRSKMVKSWGVK